jgi:hypothetical protein
MFVIVRETISTGQRWFAGRAGRAWTRDPKWAQTYAQVDAERIAQIFARDLERGVGGQRVYVTSRP